MNDLVTKQLADVARGVLTGSERMKIRVLRDILASARVSPAARKAAREGLQVWETRAKGKGWASLAAWEAVR
jgi:hypothetical protein